MCVGLASILLFLQSDLSRAIAHMIVSGLLVGFCGEIDFSRAIIELSFSIVCYLTATADV
jgi:hypothetical protein